MSLHQRILAAFAMVAVTAFVFFRLGWALRGLRERALCRAGVLPGEAPSNARSGAADGTPLDVDDRAFLDALYAPIALDEAPEWQA